MLTLALISALLARAPRLHGDALRVLGDLDRRVGRLRGGIVGGARLKPASIAV
ncbi:MAG TPA: hypothetical protein VKI43_15540 [Vicinamibacterales bacterium]|nr:hypothetical protein [Vicinamibacterales bacterium]